MTRKPAQESLPIDGVAELPTRGTLYADVNRQVAALARAGRLDVELEAGTVQQARQLAAAIDRASGLGGRKQETYALAQLHRELRELLAVLSGRTDAGGNAELLRELLGGDDVTPPDDGLQLVDPPAPRVVG